MPESWGLPVFIVVSLLFVGWFAMGTVWNVRKGDVVIKWLREGLPLVGERTTMRWMGSSAVEFKIAKAKIPFRSAETLVVFEPRDVLLLWAIARWRGRCDTLIFRSQLTSTPSFALEIFNPQGWTLGKDQHALDGPNWSRIDLPSGQPLIAYKSGDSGVVTANTLIDLATQGGGELMRLSIRRDVPNLEVHWTLPEPQSYPSRDLFLNLREISQYVIKA